MNANQDQQKPTTAIKPVTQVEKLNNTRIEEPKKEKGLEHDVDGSQDAELGSEESDEDLH